MSSPEGAAHSDSTPPGGSIGADVHLAQSAIDAILQYAPDRPNRPLPAAPPLGEGAPPRGAHGEGKAEHSLHGPGEIPSADRAEPPASALGETFLSEGQRQFQSITQWAEEGEHFFDSSRLGHRVDQAGEHTIFEARDDTRRLYKITHPGKAGFIPRAIRTKRGNVHVVADDATPLEYLERLLLQARHFNDDVRFEGVLGSAPPSLVISQPKYEAADPDNPHPTRQEIREWLSGSKQGFEQNHDGTWYDAEDDLVLDDTKPANWIKTKEGLRPIDVHMRHATPAMLTEWGAEQNDENPPSPS